MISFARRVQPIPYSKDYFVDGVGNVFSTKRGGWKKLRQSIGNHGYFVVNLTFPGPYQRVFTIHALMLESFGAYGFRRWQETRHLDGNKLNNHLSNLDANTCYVNALDKKKHDPMYLVGENHNRTHLTNADVLEIRRLREEGYANDYIAVKFGISENRVSSIYHRHSWTHI